MSLNPIVLLEKAINEHGSASVLRERLHLVKERLAEVEREKACLQRELCDARKEIEELKKKMPGSNFIEYMGAKFRRKPSGGYESTVYCPVCEVGMATIDSDMPFACGKCHSVTTFHGDQLHSILKEVAVEYS